MLLQIYKILSNLDSFPLIYDPNLFPGKNSQDIAKSNRTFPGKGRGNRALIKSLDKDLHIWIAQ